MIRLAAVSDLEEIEAGYNEHFEYEKENIPYTVFKKGVYPTRSTAENAINHQALFVYEENGKVLGSIILDSEQPEEYKKINWLSTAGHEKVMVIHLLMVRPQASGKGIGSALINYAVEMAHNRSCESIRLNTGTQNIPAAAFYKKMGFDLAASSAMKVGGIIDHNEQLFFEKVL